LQRSQSVDIKTGQEKWRTFCAAPIWSSPLIAGSHVYNGGNEGVLHCIDASSGKKEAHPFCVNAKIFSPPVISDSLMYFGADDGVLYCLKPELINNKQFNRYVYWDAAIGSLFFKNGVGSVLKDFLSRKGYTAVDHNQLLSIVAGHKNSGKGNIIVLVSSKLPPHF